MKTSILQEHREKLHLTQLELAEKSGVSVRTIQRIESGTVPKGHTLKALSKSLHVSEDDLLGKVQKPANQQLLQYVNLISIPFIVLPPLNIVAPLLLMYFKNDFSKTAKKIVDLQIAWLLLATILVVLSSFTKRFFGDNNNVTLIIICIVVAVDLYVIIKNAMELHNKGNIRIGLKFGIL